MIASGSQTPLPFTQIAVLMGVRLAEPISYTVIFPFINQMVEELGVTDNPDKVGFYSGLVESVFAFVQFFTVYHWAKLSDRIGRKPVIIMGLVGVSLSAAFFGLSTNFWMMICIRSISGALNGNVAVVKAAIGDITDEYNSTEAFAMYGLTWTVGSIIGNAIGGTLSHPYERFPAIFGRMEIFRLYPYLLPCLVCTLFTFLGIIFAWVYYVESLPIIPQTPNSSITMRLLPSSSTALRHRASSSISMMSDTETLVGSPGGKQAVDGLEDVPEVDDEGDDDGRATKEQIISERGLREVEDAGWTERREWGFWDLIKYRPVQLLCMTMFFQQFVGGAWGSVSLLFFFDRKGGLSMSTAAIGTAMSFNGLWSIACQLLLLNRIRRLLGIATAYKVLSVGWIAVFLILPLLRNLLEATETPLPSTDPLEPMRFSESRGWAVSIGVNAVLSFVTIVGMANSLLMVLINFSSPDKSALGGVNGIATAVSCMSRVVGPSLVSALFAISMDEQVLGGRLWWIFMCIMSAVSFLFTLCIPSDGGRRMPSVVAEEQDSLEV